ncbi:magnesium transporter [Candidatus Peregrinibacteria bacterium]|nr:magnesium transporter [Candidatus Peregrinibacteria bacterium]
MDSALLRRIDGLLHEKDDRELRDILEHEDTRTIADVIDELPRGKRKLFLFLPPELQSEVILLLEEDSVEAVLPRLSDFTIARFLHFMDEDDATDILQRLKPHHRTHVLALLKGDRKRRIEKLLSFKPDTAGGLMDLAFLEADPQALVSATVTAVRDFAKIHKQVPVVLIHDKGGVHWIPPRLLVSTAGGVAVGTIAKPVLSIVHSTDREQVLELMAKENCDIICVTDERDKILGVVHLNDLLRVAKEEASEDAYRMAAVLPMETPYLGTTFMMVWKKRFVWLSVLFIAELFTFTALASFDHSIAAVTVLALFVPLCISTGGNSGSQAATLVTRALALGEVTPKDWWKLLRRELLMGLALGTALGAVGFLRASFTPSSILGGADRWTLALVIGESVAAICLWGTLVGAMLPLVFRRFGFDPGYASSPFVATFVDVTGIVIYFSIAQILIV